MATPDYWLARCHVMAHSPSARRWEEDADEAVTVAAVLADDEAQVRALLQQQCHEDGLGLLRLEAIETLLQRCRREGLVQGLVELAHTTSPRHPVAYGEMLPLLPEPTPEPDPAPPTPSVNYQETRWQALFAPHRPPLWAVIDGVNCREAMARLGQAEAHSACLYASTDDATRANAPWLVRIEADSEIRTWLESLPQDQHWGLLLHSHATLKQLRSHLRKFTMLWTPANDQAPVYFRFYDPRVALDMSQALAPWKLAALMAPIEALIVPASPLMTLPSELEFIPAMELDTDANDVKGRLVRVALSDDARAANGQGRQFAIGPDEFVSFGSLHNGRAKLFMARELGRHYPECPIGDVLAAIETACQLGKQHGMTSKKQTRTLTRCVLTLGNEFPRHYPDAVNVLNDAGKLAWQKRQWIEKWLPGARLQHDFMQRQAASREHDITWRQDAPPLGNAP
ncbi:DUF4123 domain-containing protein [Vreelandella hamiltonii]|uniref:DUF4123 domain-containing protein n=1 Tax=Halomonas johnsoniae TaxID=502832 RepID=A0ABQ2WLW8_9GAMM|nr:DUF4123 domain-containing protein [Halomonas johnsoniae]GGW62133.1 hypothetical protein GCM10007158_23920 [Halomonas johnsoniae]